MYSTRYLVQGSKPNRSQMDSRRVASFSLTLFTTTTTSYSHPWQILKHLTRMGITPRTRYRPRRRRAFAALQMGQRSPFQAAQAIILPTHLLYTRMSVHILCRTLIRTLRHGRCPGLSPMTSRSDSCSSPQRDMAVPKAPCPILRLKRRL